MKNAPLVSVVIPCYNDGTYLPEAIASLEKQTFQDFEVIIVNDGSTDPLTLEVLRKAASDRITILHKENGRMSSARNFGVRHAKGIYIAALDADDFFHPTFFEKAVHILQSDSNVTVVTSFIQLFGAFRKNSKPRGGNENNFLFSNQCPACAMVRRQSWEDIGGYDELMVNGYEDWEFYIRITQQGGLVHVIPEKLLFYRQTEKSTHKNDTLTHRSELIQYIVRKHQDWYIKKLTELIINEEVLYRKSRISFQVITEMLKNRITKKYN